MKKIISIVLYILMAISIVTLVLVFVMGAPDYKGVSIMLGWTYILLGIAVVSAVLFPLINLAQNPKAALRTLVGVGVVAVVLLVAYLLSSSQPLTLSDGVVYDNGVGLKLTDTGLYTAYFALAGALLVAIVGEIRNSFK